jgi:hypothetical protein
MSFGIRSKVLIIAILGAALLATAGWRTAHQADRTAAIQEDAARFAKGQELAADIDMMHDAIRADVLTARLAAATRDAAMAAQASADLSEHAERMRTNHQELAALDLAGVDTLVEASANDIAGYLAGGQRIVAGDAADAAIVEFDRLFERLEQALDQPGEEIVAHARRCLLYTSPSPRDH